MLGTWLCTWIFITAVLWFFDDSCECSSVKTESKDDDYDEEYCWLYD